MLIPQYFGDVPYLTTDQMIEVDRAMMEDYKIELIQMMENAGRNLAQLARLRFLDGDPKGKKVLVLAGSGGNGGGALVSARRLHNYGAFVDVIISKPAKSFTSTPAHQLDILKKMQIPIHEAGGLGSISETSLIIDGIIGYSLRGAPRGFAADLIIWANEQTAPILALDTPSGIDTARGTVHEPSIKAAATLTLALPKEGHRNPLASANIGELYLADISVPPELYAHPPLNLDVDYLFRESDILRLR